MLRHRSINKETAEELANSINVLIITATNVETDSFHQFLCPYDTHVLKVSISARTYYIGRFGNYFVAHFQTQAGSSTEGGSSVSTAAAIAFWKPKAVVMVGIAFGIDNKYQKIGDVLISERLLPYESQRVGDIRLVERGGSPPASQLLRDRFKNIQDWNYEYKIDGRSKAVKPKILPGLILTGEKLIDNLEFRDKLKERFPEAIGGEMEGAGISSACSFSKIDWIIVKGICDFADGHKGKNKKLYQNIAAKSASNLCHHVFSETFILDELEIEMANDQSVKEDILISEKRENDYNAVLFKAYAKTLEKYYFERAIDEKFNIYISEYSIWLWGTSGVGKSTIIQRNLQIVNRNIIQIWLGSTHAEGIGGILREILHRIEIHFRQEPKYPGADPKRLIELIAALLETKLQAEPFILHFDEIPDFRNPNVFVEFIDALYGISNKIQGISTSHSFIFALSSISSPKAHLLPSQSKFYEHFKIIEVDVWTTAEISEFVKFIDRNLKMGLSSTELDQIIASSHGSPRRVKQIFRDLIATQKLAGYSLQRILNEIETDSY